MTLLSPIDAKYSRLLRGDDFARIIPPEEFTPEEWESIMLDAHIPALVEFGRSLSVPASEQELLHREAIKALLPQYFNAVQRHGYQQTFQNVSVRNSAQVGTAFPVPALIYKLLSKLWGAGGGSGGSYSSGHGGNGGGGAFVQATFNVVPLENLTFTVGAPGGPGSVGVNGSYAAPGGGSGGYSALYRSATLLALSAAGAGSGGADLSNRNGGDGAPGGNSTTGFAGGSPSAGASPGGAGSTTAGGAGGSGAAGTGGAGSSLQGGVGGSGGTAVGTRGSAGTPGGNQGGAGSNGNNCGGGGAGAPGLYGGGGGGQPANNGGAGGGGGSGPSYVNPTGSADAQFLVGGTQGGYAAATYPGGFTDPDRPGSNGAGGAYNNGSSAGNAGQPGAVVFRY